MDKLRNRSVTVAGAKVLSYGHQWIDNEDIDAVVKELPLGER